MSTVPCGKPSYILVTCMALSSGRSGRSGELSLLRGLSSPRLVWVVNFSLRSWNGGGVGHTFTMCPVPWQRKHLTSSLQSRAKCPFFRHRRHLITLGCGATPCSLSACITPSVTIATSPLMACSAAPATIFGLFGAPPSYLPRPAPCHCLLDIFCKFNLNTNSQISTVLTTVTNCSLIRIFYRQLQVS